MAIRLLIPAGLGMTMDASHSVCYNVNDLNFLKNRIYFVLEDKLLPGSNLASYGLRKMLV